MIKYPNGQNYINKTNNSLKSLGMMFENALNESNDYYLSKDIAIIHKKPTPIQVVKVDYPKRSASKIVEAYYKTPSTTDYNGIYKGKYIDYEAKETVKTLFPFKHIFPHQVEHLYQVRKMGGIAFVIIYFRMHNEIYIFDIDSFYDLYKNGAKKSINREDAMKIGYLVPISYSPIIDYIKIVDLLINKDDLKN